MKAILSAAILAALLSGPAAAQSAPDDASALAKWLGPNAPECVSVGDIKAAVKTIDLTPDQFQFARALYVAIPPVSKELPPGDHALLASDGKLTMVALVDGDQTCARFLAPDFVLSMLIEVGEGETPHPGEPI